MFYHNIVLKHFDALKILNRVELQKEPCVAFIVFISHYPCFPTFAYTMLMINSSYVSLRRHSRMYIYVTMQNFSPLS